MISRNHKFSLRTEFFRFRSTASRTVTPHLIIYTDVSENPSRLATIVPKKVNKLATIRNYLKRLILDTLWPQIKDQKIDMVVVFKSLPLKKTQKLKTELVNELTQNLRNF